MKNPAHSVGYKLVIIIIKKIGMMVGEQGLVVVYKKIKEECSLT